MTFPPKFWVLYLLVIGPVFVFAQAPQVVPAQDLPASFHYISSVSRTAESIVISGEDGVTVGGSSGWSLLRTPRGGGVAFTLPFQTGFFAAGEDFGYVYVNGVWRDLRIDDNLYSGAELDGELLISGRRGIYHIDRDGSVQSVMKQNSRSNYFVHQLNHRLVLFAVNEGVFAWDGAKRSLVPLNDLYPWSLHREVTCVQEQGKDNYFVGTSDGVFVENATGEHPFLPEAMKKILTLGLISVVRFGDTVVAVTWKGGLFGFSFAEGKMLWTISPEVFSGTLNTASLQDEGLVIGSSNGVWLLPDPDRYVISSLPRGDVYFASHYKEGIFIGLNSGQVVDEKGASRKLGEAFSMAQLEGGEVVSGRWGRIIYKGTLIDVGGQEVAALAPLDASHLAFLQPGAAEILDLNTGAVSRLRLARTPNSIAATQTGKLLVGTSDGIFTFSSTGVPGASFGQGASRVRSVHDGAIGLDSTGRLYDGEGKVIATLPVSELVDAEEWAGELCLLVRTPDGTPWIGQVKKSGWVPLDIPTPVAPEDLVVTGDELLVVGAGMIVRTSNPRVLAAPQAQAFLLNAKGDLFPGARAGLSSSEDTVDLVLGPGRLGPWRNPSLTFRAGTGAWVSIAPGARVAIPRLSWGATPIVVRSQWAGLSQETDLAVFRETPGWARYPAFFGYFLATVLLGYGVVRWRTAQLEKRAARLERVVEQRTAQLRQAQQAREDFFSMMSHEIRNPLNGVVGLCEIVENAAPEAVAPRERMLLKTLRGCADQLRSILDDILDFSRIDRGEIQLHEEVFELLEAVEGSAQGVDAGLKRCILELPENRLWVRGDCGKIRQIVTNLVSNALKYGVPPTARVLVQVAEPSTEQADVSIRVLNTGNTIPADELRQIFEGYMRGDDARRRRISGTGLGLAVSRRIALAMKGTLDATSVNGLTEFRLDLKLHVAAEPAEVPKEAVRPKNSRALGIEDEPYNRLVLGSILGQLGYEVDWAVDGAEALAHVRTGSYDLILTDFMLPDTTGTELAKKLIEMLSEPKPPIIAVTAYSTPEKMRQAKDAGIAGFVTKPVSRKKIELAILAAVGDFSVGRALDVPAIECNFAPLLRLEHGAQKLAEYADDLPRAWGRVLAAFEQQETPAERVRTIHAFRSRVLAVHATSISDQIALLEDAAQQDQREDVRRLVTVIAPLLQELEKAARFRALTDLS